MPQIKFAASFNKKKEDPFNISSIPQIRSNARAFLALIFILTVLPVGIFSYIKRDPHFDKYTLKNIGCVAVDFYSRVIKQKSDYKSGQDCKLEVARSAVNVDRARAHELCMLATYNSTQCSEFEAI